MADFAAGGGSSALPEAQRLDATTEDMERFPTIGRPSPHRGIGSKHCTATIQAIHTGPSLRTDAKGVKGDRLRGCGGADTVDLDDIIADGQNLNGKIQDDRSSAGD